MMKFADQTHESAEGSARIRCDFVFKMMDFVSQMMTFFKIKMTNFVMKMMSFAGKLATAGSRYFATKDDDFLLIFN